MVTGKVEMARKYMFEWGTYHSRWMAKSNDEKARNEFILHTSEIIWENKMNVHGAT